MSIFFLGCNINLEEMLSPKEKTETAKCRFEHKQAPNLHLRWEDLTRKTQNYPFT